MERRDSCLCICLCVMTMSVKINATVTHKNAQTLCTQNSAANAIGV